MVRWSTSSPLVFPLSKSRASVVKDSLKASTMRVPTETGKYIKTEGHRREFLFNFFFARTRLIWTYFSQHFMYNTKSLANSSSKVLSRGRHCFFMNSKGVIISSANCLFGLDRGKSPFRPCQMCGKGRKNTPSRQTPLLLCPLRIATRSTEKSSKSL